MRYQAIMSNGRKATVSASSCSEQLIHEYEKVHKLEPSLNEKWVRVWFTNFAGYLVGRVTDNSPEAQRLSVFFPCMQKTQEIDATSRDWEPVEHVQERARHDATLSMLRSKLEVGEVYTVSQLAQLHGGVRCSDRDRKEFLKRVISLVGVWMPVPCDGSMPARLDVWSASYTLVPSDGAPAPACAFRQCSADRTGVSKDGTVASAGHSDEALQVAERNSKNSSSEVDKEYQDALGAGREASSTKTTAKSIAAESISDGLESRATAPPPPPGNAPDNGRQETAAEGQAAVEDMNGLDDVQDLKPAVNMHECVGTNDPLDQEDMNHHPNAEMEEVLEVNVEAVVSDVEHVPPSGEEVSAWRVPDGAHENAHTGDEASIALPRAGVTGGVMYKGREMPEATMWEVKANAYFDPARDVGVPSCANAHNSLRGTTLRTGASSAGTPPTHCVAGASATIVRAGTKSSPRSSRTIATPSLSSGVPAYAASVAAPEIDNDDDHAFFKLLLNCPPAPPSDSVRIAAPNGWWVIMDVVNDSLIAGSPQELNENFRLRQGWPKHLSVLEDEHRAERKALARDVCWTDPRARELALILLEAEAALPWMSVKDSFAAKAYLAGVKASGLTVAERSGMPAACRLAGRLQQLEMSIKPKLKKLSKKSDWLTKVQAHAECMKGVVFPTNKRGRASTPPVLSARDSDGMAASTDHVLDDSISMAWELLLNLEWDKMSTR